MNRTWYIIRTSYFFFILVTGGSFYFAIKFRKKGERKFTPGISHNLTLELFWTIIPTILVFVIFVWGFNTYLKMSIPPGDAQELKVTAFMKITVSGLALSIIAIPKQKNFIAL